MNMLSCVVSPTPPIYAPNPTWTPVKCFACETFALVRLSFTEVFYGKA